MMRIVLPPIVDRPHTALRCSAARTSPDGSGDHHTGGAVAEPALIPPLSQVIGGVVMAGQSQLSDLLPVDAKLMVFTPLTPN